MAFREIIFLDTTYLLPFFQIPLTVKGFNKKLFEKILREFEYVYISEVSVLECLSKITRMYFKGKVPEEIFEIFKENLSILREDEKITFKPIQEEDVKTYYELLKINPEIDPIDRIILAQATHAQIFLTEDSDILEFSNNKTFKKKYLVKVLNWKKLLNYLNLK